MSAEYLTAPVKSLLIEVSRVPEYLSALKAQLPKCLSARSAQLSECFKCPSALQMASECLSAQLPSESTKEFKAGHSMTIALALA